MVSLETPICDFGWKAPDFTLEGVDGKTYSLKDVMGPNGVLVMFICNHCPYVKSIADRLATDVMAMQKIGIGVIAIMSNDPEYNNDDSFDNMKLFARDNGFTFPYVIDETQDIARAYDAVCTPDFFGFNASLELQYRGRIDESGRNPAPPGARRELLDAMTQIAETGQGPSAQTASMGCSIKWRPQAA